MKKSYILLMALLFVIGISANTFGYDFYDIQTWDVPSNDGYGTSIKSINNNGDMVGYYNTAVSYPAQSRTKSFFLEGNNLSTGRGYPDPRATDTLFLDVNNFMHRVGSYWIRDSVTGVVTEEHGFYNLGALPNTPVPTTGLIASFPHFSRTLGINDADQMVGRFSDNQGTHGVFYQDPKDLSKSIPYDYPGAIGTTGLTDINDVGQIVGLYWNSSNVTNSFVLDTDGNIIEHLTSQGVLQNTRGMRINNNGLIVGYLDNGNPGNPNYRTVGFVHMLGYQGNENGEFQFPGAVSTRIWGVNDSNEIVGDYLGENGLHGFKAKVRVPEPTTLLLLGLGLIGLVGIRRKL